MQEWKNKVADALRKQEMPSGAWEVLDLASRTYCEQTPAPEAAADILALWQMGAMRQQKRVVLPVFDGQLVVKVFSLGKLTPLSQGIEMLARFGLKVVDYRASALAIGARENAWIQYFTTDQRTLDSVDLAQTLQGAFDGSAECDQFSRLSLVAGLSAKEIVLLRACAAYRRQIGSVFNQEAMAEVLIRHPTVTAAIVARFSARFSPARQSEAAVGVGGAQSAAFSALLSAIPAADDCRVLTAISGLVDAMVRTNFFQTDADGKDKACLAFKLDCARVEGLPAPRPLFEIFVYSPCVEGVHLRGGKVARGGLRWSDRLHDFRTEVHGLFKAQMVKNVVIVPEGAKGGFVLKQAGALAGEALRREAVACYSIFIRGLLDLTDNLVDDQIVPPADLVRHDEDDPYLVVAADKGTASFSDIANGIAAEYGFWLGDAFASGGSVGYDHKQLGITARGAWEAVKRHFREGGLDAQNDPIEVVGVGDMSGDVFGNGLLLSARMSLVGAFDHRHIFVDPQPLSELAYAERQRLFAQATSSWADYRSTASGPGAAVYARTEAKINLSPEAQARFGLAVEVTPDQLIQSLLRAEVDLLWLGGIGTYVRAADEADDGVGDRNNDAVRIEARQLRARVIGEGANLGVTQRGRVEAALHGIALNTDAIDNAGGVSCSDHEVNIKILLDSLVRAGKLSPAERVELLGAMSDEVCALVLRDVQLQTEALSLASARAMEDLDRHRRLISFFERSGQLERHLAGLPLDDALAERRAKGRGLTRPELSVLLAHTKVALFGEFIASDLPDDPLLERDLLSYFPTPLRTRFRDVVAHHPLRREIVTTAVVNSMVNRVGSGFVNDIYERTGASDSEVSRAYLVARELFSLESLWADIEALDTAQSSPSHVGLMLVSREITERVTLWLLRHRPSPIDISSTVAELRPLIEQGLLVCKQAGASQPEMQSHFYRTRLASLKVPSRLAERMNSMWRLAENLDVLVLASARGKTMGSVECAASAIEEALDIPLLKNLLSSVLGSAPHEASARGELLDITAGVATKLLSRNDLPEEGSDYCHWLKVLLEPHRARLALYRSRCRTLENADRRDLAGAVLVVSALTALAS